MPTARTHTLRPIKSCTWSVPRERFCVSLHLFLPCIFCPHILAPSLPVLLHGYPITAKRAALSLISCFPPSYSTSPLVITLHYRAYLYLLLRLSHLLVLFLKFSPSADSISVSFLYALRLCFKTSRLFIFNPSIFPLWGFSSSLLKLFPLNNLLFLCYHLPRVPDMICEGCFIWSSVSGSSCCHIK